MPSPLRHPDACRAAVVCAAAALLLAGCAPKQDTPENRDKSAKSLKMLSVAMGIYMQDYDQRIPPAADLATLRPILRPYIATPADTAATAAEKEKTIFASPVTGAAYVMNPSIGGRMLGEIGDPALVVAFYEPEPNWEGGQRRLVATVDGRVKLMGKTEWDSARQLSKIP